MRDYLVYLDDIVAAIKKIEKDTEKSTIADLRRNELLMGSIIRNLETIGTAVKNIPIAARKDHPGVEWKKLAGLGDILVHDDINLDVEFVWDIVKGKLPLLKQTALKMLE